MPILREAFAEFLGSLEVTQRLASTVVRSNSASHSQWIVRSNSASHSQWIVRSNSASHSPWIVRSNSASHSPWIVRSNSASHSPWIVRQVAFYIEIKTIYYIKFLACNLLTRTKCRRQRRICLDFLTLNSRD
ncbi:hypothetical protein LEP1GSC008_2055 [Leptospira kirschneri serovar Bulgarica str. Nikolaevo]|uniref:Uncharacterized protein n=1 Tax=Leptospira kirschneri serovar Bulgarica str. Nikolaevo TaxID=1240687 RepID=M6F7B3_9LEPT|nr:hypothetical protein LEP1GSC008_2055 [Leptospira kirschneri serovar Bulgarica str. Nikolaevo]